MLQNSDTNIKEVLSIFSRFDTDVALVVPTETGLRKSIIDATENVRTHFRKTGFHDYHSQAQGALAKALKKAHLLYGDSLQDAKISLYRPETKSGDPRLWVYGLKKYASAGNLIAIFTTKSTAYVINCSDPVNRASLVDPESKIAEILGGSTTYKNTTFDRLMRMIKAVSDKGFVPSLRHGDTGVGMTLEAHLGILANSAQEPDYEGIEIKARRLGKNRIRSTLFSQVPNWDLSPIGSAWNLLTQVSEFSLA